MLKGLLTVADAEGQSGHSPPSSLAIDFAPLARRNKLEILENILNCPLRGHSFMMSTKDQVFDPLPLSTCVHMSQTLPSLVDVHMRST